MFCIKCGAKLPEESRFCVRCGEKIKSINTAESKVCPYCKKGMPSNSTSCPNCSRTLTESVSRKEHKIESQSEINYRSRAKKKKLNLKPIVIIGIIILFGYLIFSEDVSTSDNSLSNGTSLNTGQNPPQALEDKQKPTIDSLRENSSLPNNTVIESNSYYQMGDGELHIDNGTSYDAVAKLVKTSLGQSVYTVYIKSNSEVAITDISDGYYDLYFVHGQDWDSVNKDFNYNKSYSKFEEGFNFQTEETRRYDGIYEEYTVFDVTLHGVFGGTAETETVAASEFNNF